MAKVSARGRTTLVEVERVRDSRVETGKKYWDRRRYMSDGRVLYNTAYGDGFGRFWLGWRVANGGQRLNSPPDEWLKIKLEQGWTLVQSTPNK